jgi:HTH-type transcriptional regulator/antitoxin HigA
MGDKIMSGRIKPIKNDADYEEALSLMADLVSCDPAPNTEKADQLSVLAILIENYEKTHFPLDIPSAVDAIKFRMDQLGLRPVDLVPYLGSASRVSEILSGKRALTVDMINALSTGLGIPEKALLKNSENENDYSRNIPNPIFKQMIARGYFEAKDNNDKPNMLKQFFAAHSLQPAALYRKSKFRTDNTANHYVLVAWANRVVEKAKLINSKNEYIDGLVNLEYMRNIAKYSEDEDDGAKNAIEQLLSNGIKVVIEPALEGTKLDGICILEDKSHPIIGLTLRYDRLDNFWFTLMHELAHVSKHLNLDETFIYDDFESKDDHLSGIEKEADSLAGEALVDSSKWLVSAARIVPSPITASCLAKELGVHPVIIAGKARYETGKWSYLSKMVKEHKIRNQFKEIVW